MSKLSEEAINERLKEIPDWERLDEKWIERKYTFDNYLSGIKFVDQVAAYAENEEQHHPNITIDYKTVSLQMSSWHTGGLTGQDLRMAGVFDSMYRDADK